MEKRPQVSKNLVVFLIIIFLLYMLIGYVTGNLHPWGPTVYVHGG